MRRAIDTWEAGFFKVLRILDHRVLRGGTIEYEIEWDGKRLDGTPWRAIAAGCSG